MFRKSLIMITSLLSISNLSCMEAALEKLAKTQVKSIKKSEKLHALEEFYRYIPEILAQFSMNKLSAKELSAKEHQETMSYFEKEFQRLNAFVEMFSQKFSDLKKEKEESLQQARIILDNYKSLVNQTRERNKQHEEFIGLVEQMLDKKNEDFNRISTLLESIKKDGLTPEQTTLAGTIKTICIKNYGHKDYTNSPSIEIEKETKEELLPYPIDPGLH